MRTITSFSTPWTCLAQTYEPDGTTSGRNYILYAYCLMSNHIHLLSEYNELIYGFTSKR